MSSLNVVSSANNSLVPVRSEFSRKRTVSLPRTNSSSRRARTNVRTMQKSGLYRYLKARGTPTGAYEIPRTIVWENSFDSSGFAVGAARYEGIAFDFSPLGIGVTYGPGGSRTTQTFANSTEFSAIFDKCKIQSVDITIQCPNPGVSGTTGGVPVMLIAEDDNDASPGWDVISQMNCDSWNPGFNVNEWKGRIKPKFQQIVYYTSVLSSYQPQRGYVVADTAIPHYGLKCAIKYQQGAGTLRFVFKVNFAFKEPK